jgi:hypothetical protein
MEPASRVERARILLPYREDPSFFAVSRALGLHHQTVQRRTSASRRSPPGGAGGANRVPETCANLIFGGPLRNRLYMCASTSVYAVYVNVQGAAVP